MTAESNAEHLDRNYRYQRHVYDLTREYFLLGRKRLLAELDPPRGGSVLEVGCGTALNLIRANRRYPGATYMGVDLSRMMLDTAAKAIARSGSGAHIRVALGNAADFDATALFGRDRFDRIVFSYSLSMIPPWEAALDHAAGLLARGGRIHIVDFGAAEGLPAPVKLALDGWLARFRVRPREGLEAVLAALAGRRGLSLHFERLYRAYTYYGVLARG